MTAIAPEGLDLHHPDIERRLAVLGTAEKVALLTGADHWRTASAPAAGLRSILMSDGPVGVRGELWDERRPSVNFPSATVLAATWDPDLAQAYGRALGAEARRRGVQVLLGPTVNIQRSPLAGRHFECFSEDPVLTGALAAALVAGLQSTGVAAAPKHYVANDYETERFTASSEVPADALHEVYLRPFEDAVTRGGAWLVMSAYNAVNGTTASEHPLLTDPLRTAWEFDGVVVSDWGGVRSVRAAATGQDLVMPGPHGPWGDALVRAIEEGSGAARGRRRQGAAAAAARGPGRRPRRRGPCGGPRDPRRARVRPPGPAGRRRRHDAAGQRRRPAARRWGAAPGRGRRRPRRPRAHPGRRVRHGACPLGS